MLGHLQTRTETPLVIRGAETACSGTSAFIDDGRRWTTSKLFLRSSWTQCPPGTPMVSNHCAQADRPRSGCDSSKHHPRI